MGRRAKLLRRVLSARSDASTRFRDLRRLLFQLGFEERIRGGHHIFSHAEVDKLLNLQRERGDAKPYQVRQVRELLVRYGFGAEDGCTDTKS